MTVRPATPQDVPAITAIQNAHLDSEPYEWRETPHSPAEKSAWLDERRAAGQPVLVAVDGDQVVGWASYGAFRKWPGYRWTAEHTIHVRDTHQGAGVGRLLMDALLAHARANGIHVLVAGIDSENTGSIAFHERLGFTEVARMPQVGQKFGTWRDLVLLQLRLDDRPEPPQLMPR